MTRVVKIALIVTTMLASVPAAQQALTANCPQRVHEIGLYGGYEHDIAVLDDVTVHLHNNPNLKLFIVSFGEPRGTPGAQFRLAHMCWNYVVKTKGFPPERTVRLHARDGVGLRAEIWIGDSPPQLRTIELPTIELRRLPIVYDRYDAAFSGELSWVEEEDEDARLSSFAAVLKANPTLVGEIVGFAGTPGKGFLGERLSGSLLATREVDSLVKRFGVARSRLRIRNGGRKQMATVELWLRDPRPSN
jgi:hypothetical protein